MAQSLEPRPTVVDFREDNPWVKLAHAHWSDAKKVRKVKPEVIKQQLWDPLEAEGFTNRSLLILENLNVLEKCVSRQVTLLPHFHRTN
jgi:intron-binding protein aquarius